MNGYERRYGWMVPLAVVLLSTVAGIVAYNMGVSHGFAQSAAEAGDALPDGWHRHWGFGFGFPFFFLLFWFVLLRGFWGWGGPWRRHGYYYPGWHDVPPPFDEWHRRAHDRMDDSRDRRDDARDRRDDSRDRMKENPSADDPGRRG